MPANRTTPKDESTFGAEPSLGELRKSLLGSRSQRLKAWVAVGALIALIGMTIQRSHLASSTNLASGGEVVSTAVAKALTARTDSLRMSAEALLISTEKHFRAGLGIATPPPDALRHTPTVNAESHRVHRTVNSARGHKKLASADVLSSAMQTPRSVGASSFRGAMATLRSFITADSIAAGIIGLLLYVLFATLLIRKKGGLRAFARSQTA